MGSRLYVVPAHPIAFAERTVRCDRQIAVSHCIKMLKQNDARGAASRTKTDVASKGALRIMTCTGATNSKKCRSLYHSN